MANKKSQGRSLKERAQDDLVMSTNSSSIVSKRSVERIYYPNEPHFFRFFVKKFQRRSPLINRGYHLRLHVIDVAVRNFLQRPSTRRKVVVNLGAGFDVLPWQCLTRYASSCDGVKFIDIDFPDLMQKKHRLVQETVELNSLLTNSRASDDPLVLMDSDQYTQMGCDLRELDSIRQSLSKLLDLEHSEFMFVAEVSITYMETTAADAVIEWANALGQAEFCLLEQILPDGADHPFAETMLRHFEKLKTPIKSVAAYPTIEAQKDRFVRLGWSSVHAETLWSTWSSEKYLSREDRRTLNEIEPFDEWEEFAIFGGHYCVVSAKNRPLDGNTEAEVEDDSPNGLERLPRLQIASKFHEATKTSQRRFGSPMMFNNAAGQQFFANLFGLGGTSRLRSLDLYGKGSMDVQLRPAGPPSRMCHQTVDLGCYGVLLIGGRASPSAGMKDCWLFDKIRKLWHRKEDLPQPLYRHAAVRLGRSGLALVIGGKTGPSTIFDSCLLYNPEKGWTECTIVGQRHLPVQGSIIANSTQPQSGSPFVHQGILAGGLLEDGILAKQHLRWEVDTSDLNKPVISFKSISASDRTSNSASYGLLDRFGATTVTDANGRLLVIGGVVHDHILEHQNEVLLLELSGEEIKIVSAGQLDSDSIPRPLLVGLSAALDDQGRVLLTGGGATCFSMGTFWNKGYYVVDHRSPNSGLPRCVTIGEHENWSLRQTLELTDTPTSQTNTSSDGKTGKPALTTVPRIVLGSSNHFAEIVKAGKPVIIEKASLGAAVVIWTPEHIVSKVGKDRKVIVHEAATSRMDFNAKNFKYITKEFGAFMEDAAKGAKLYLRALSGDSPSDKPASLGEDFPGLCEDFVLPPELAFVVENMFSSVLRVTGQVNMWLHYDVMANIYCQIVGSKRLILFPPSDIGELSFPPGASSSSLDVFTELETASLASTSPHEAVLGPGDVLFLPPLWMHTAAPISDLGVAVNVFFRNLESGYSAGRDVYGNRDLAAYEKGRQDVARVVNAFGKFPVEVKEFYVRRLASELSQKLHE